MCILFLPFAGGSLHGYGVAYLNGLYFCRGRDWEGVRMGACPGLFLASFNVAVVIIAYC